MVKGRAGGYEKMNREGESFAVWYALVQVVFVIRVMIWYFSPLVHKRRGASIRPRELGLREIENENGLGETIRAIQ